jgi:8-oxo-dGTP diphosphatase
MYHSSKESEAEMKTMVAGLYYDPNTEMAVFIRKNRPVFMKGRLNLPGGHVEDGETPAEAMAREFKEEVDIQTAPDQWRHTITLQDEKNEWVVHFFMAEGDGSAAKTMTDEPVERYDAWNMPFDALPNLRWIVPLSMDKMVVQPILLWDKN